MSSHKTIKKALDLVNSPLSKTMESAIEEAVEFNENFQNGKKSAGAKARKKTTEWGKAVTERIKQLREAKTLFASYRKESIDESK